MPIFYYVNRAHRKAIAIDKTSWHLSGERMLPEIKIEVKGGNDQGHSRYKAKAKKDSGANDKVYTKKDDQGRIGGNAQPKGWPTEGSSGKKGVKKTKMGKNSRGETNGVGREEMRGEVGSNESKRPHPKERLEREGIHPHPGPGGQREIYEEVNMETINITSMEKIPISC